MARLILLFSSVHRVTHRQKTKQVVLEEEFALCILGTRSNPMAHTELRLWAPSAQDIVCLTYPVCLSTPEVPLFLREFLRNVYKVCHLCGSLLSNQLRWCDRSTACWSVLFVNGWVPYRPTSPAVTLPDWLASSALCGKLIPTCGKVTGTASVDWCVGLPLQPHTPTQRELAVKKTPMRSAEGFVFDPCAPSPYNLCLYF